MPRIHSQAKQKNKPYKGKSSGKKNDGKMASTKTKHISKKVSLKRIKTNKAQMVKQKKMRRINQVQKLTKQNQYLDAHTKSIITQKMKEQSEIKIVLLLPCNEDADVAALIKQIYDSLDKETVLVRNSETGQGMNGFRAFGSFQMFPASNKTFLKSKLQFIAPSRNVMQLMDLAKCCDIVCPVLSCKATNTQGMNLDPHLQGKAFDQTGYTILNMLRSMGVPTTVGIIQHLETHHQKHHDKITRLFKRFMSSELGQDEKIVTVSGQSDLNKLLRTIDSVAISNQAWKKQRGYMLVENVRKSENGNIVLEGFLKGNCVNANQLVHITGLDDFQIESIQIKKNQGKFVRNKKNTMSNQQQSQLIQYATNPQSLFALAQTIDQKLGNNQSQNQLLSALEGLKLQAQTKKAKLDVQQIEQDFEDMSDQDASQEFDQEQILGDKDQQRQKRIQLQMRKQDQLQFQDEVEYTADELLRQKFRSCQGLKNFKTSEWNQLQNLPEQYDRIYTFKHYSKTHSTAQSQNLSRAFAYPGFFLSITLKSLPQASLQPILLAGPLLLSFLLKHQRKMTTLHTRVKRNPFYESPAPVESNQQYLITMGFRRFYATPIFSKCINGTEKTKFARKVAEGCQGQYLCSFYYYNCFGQAPVGVYRVNRFCSEQVQHVAVMYGELVKCDPLHVVLERIILCGYPYKINRRRSTIRYMFFHPKDVKFFKPIEVITKMGLRGRIEQSLGTKGLMKVMFSDHIKHNDTVCMYLYKRVYPQANF